MCQQARFGGLLWEPCKRSDLEGMERGSKTNLEFSKTNLESSKTDLEISKTELEISKPYLEGIF